MSTLDELRKFDIKPTNETARQTPAEKLKAMRPTEPIPPRIIIHSLDGNKQDKIKNGDR